MTTAPRFTLGRSLLFSTILVLGFFVLAEGILRVLGLPHPVATPRLIVRQMDTDITLPFMREDPEVFWSPRPGWKGEFRGKPVTINALGLRGPEVVLPKPAGTKRVACFGDSITFGFGVADDETYSRFLAAEIEAHGGEVVNAGITGYTSHQVLRLMTRLAPELQMDVATILIGWNDQNKRAMTDREYEKRLRAATAVEGTLDRLRLFKAMRALYVGAALQKQPGGGTGQRVPLPEYLENMEGLVSLCRSQGVKPVFVELPRRRKSGEPRYESSYAVALRELAGKLAVPVLGVGELGLETLLDSNEADFIDLIHMSRAGNQVMAREIARQLLALGLL
jgi:lysophospholipase L1-like esterase